MNDIQTILANVNKTLNNINNVFGVDGLKTDITVSIAPINFAYIFGSVVGAVLVSYGIIQLIKK